MTPRAALRIAGLVGLLVLLAPIHIVTKAMFGRSGWPPRFLAFAARIAGARVRMVGERPRPGTLLVANHSSWLDILILGGATGCAFVSKDQLGHPLVHWLADQNHTIYVNRSARRQVGEQTAALTSAIERGAVVAFFPEGTTGPGDRLLPFRPPLFAAATDRFPVRPVAIDYGAARTEISWFEEAGKDNILRVLGRAGTFRVTIRLLAPLPAGDRKRLAAQASDTIAHELGFKSPAPSPIDEEQ
ncbi:lysophospholipid acyltransferase family protein [Sphingomonas sp.]|uniref:lysophospholipid acyltransferase family protein n=1 Tax=Sphingomonas sp. TaxID=28214 RepID=UPI0025FDD066|nr:lysophospholipid acyltransferase family protein [Sphingomonas sp.]MBV9527662.1 1-acyl-sn-glycerol-3-phosphate acyltransferase [Sphingomonas sp.]